MKFVLGATAMAFGLVCGSGVAQDRPISVFDSSFEDILVPPDPGVAGMATIEGIDADQDGVRDDIQRQIVEMAPGSRIERSALSNVATALQNTLADSEIDASDLESLVRAQECLEYVLGSEAAGMAGELQALVLNTPERSQAYGQFAADAGTQIIPMRPVSAWADSCASLSVPVAPSAKGIDTFCSDTQAVIVYGNGVLNSLSDAADSLATLQRQLRARLDPESFEALEFALAYNASNGLSDFLEALGQDFQTSVSQLWRGLAGLAILPDPVADRILDFAMNYDAQAAANNADLSRHIRYYQTQILEGKKVIIVPHSQGNFFANQAYANLTTQEQASVGIAAVATPDQFVPGGYGYTTLVTDRLITAINVALPGNVSNGLGGIFADFPVGHNFIKAYMAAGSNSATRILNQVEQLLDSVAEPPTSAGQGIITVTLTWGAEPDLDLHAFEPDGTHVYYANRTGNAGFLDVDDVTSFGPEHYFVGCDSLVAGEYSIGVNYYRGSGPETANVQIKAGEKLREFSRVLTEALGSSGNAQPSHIANIKVLETVRGFEFSVD